MLPTTHAMVNDVAKYVINLLESTLPAIYVFHNAEHTKEVALAAQALGEAHRLGESDMNVLLTAAWFHDAGYTESYNDHEAASVRIAEEYLSSRFSCEAEFIGRVRSCILATQMPQTPRTIVEKILCDADLANLGSDSFFDMSARLRKEIQDVKGQRFSNAEWHAIQLNICKHHRFHTDYARRIWGTKQLQNIALLEEQQSIFEDTPPY
jgi:predicted metal-dependent HD superfamily phosphohydrolase